MDQATQERLTARIRELRRRRSTDLAASTYRVPAADYTSAAVHAAEVERLFVGGPLLAGLSADAAAPGDWFSFDACGRSAVIWRGADGTLRAFVNACRHRGMRIASGCGHASRDLTCPYHAWSYDTDGKLAAIPGGEGFSDVDRDGLRLARLPVHEEAGLVYVGLTPSAGTPSEPATNDGSATWRRDVLLGGAETEIRPFDLASYTRIDRREHRFDVNWKLTVDSFLESYHLHALHKDTLRPVFHGNMSIFDAFGRNCRIMGIRRSFDELMQATNGASLLPHVTILYLLFPNAVLIHQQDHVELVQSFPDLHDPNVGYVRTTLYAPEPPQTDAARAYWKKNLDLIDGVTTTEDFAACEKIQANLRVGAVPFLVLGRNEPGVAHFHRMLHAAVGAAAEA